MNSLLISLINCAFVIPFVNSEARTFKNSDMCDRDLRLNNCSFQVPSSHPNSCLIYKTDACMKNEFRPWILEQLHKPKLEPDSDLIVSIEPYPFYTDDMQKNDPVSAINISLTSFNRNISGFAILMNREYDAPPKNVCRVIDFRNSLDDIKIPFQFFYDCFHNLREAHWRNVFMTFRAYPVNIELSYQVYIPRVSREISNSSCAWSPLVMVYKESLSRNHIQLKFSNPHNDSNIVFFIVTLLDLSDVEVDKTRIPSYIKNDMISCEFQSVKSGYYSISVTLSLPKQSCVVFKSDLFLIGPEVKDFEVFKCDFVNVIHLLSVIVEWMDSKLCIFNYLRRFSGATFEYQLNWTLFEDEWNIFEWNIVEIFMLCQAEEKYVK